MSSNANVFRPCQKVKFVENDDDYADDNIDNINQIYSANHRRTSLKMQSAYFDDSSVDNDIDSIDEVYNSLPLNVQNAVVNAQKKTARSHFYYKLLSLNDKLSIYKDLFYSNEQEHVKTYKKKKTFIKNSKA